jgi:cell division septum initiation protein DivIVA
MPRSGRGRYQEVGGTVNEPGVVPLGAGFDIEFRGFNRKQVAEHIELLEEQLKLTAIDRDEASQVNADLHRLCDELRGELDEARGQLTRIETSETGVARASQRMYNMLLLAEEEAEAVRERAQRHAETVRGMAETDARQIRAEAEAEAAALCAECERKVGEIEAWWDWINAEHVRKTDALRSQHEQIRGLIRNEYEQAMVQARHAAEELLTLADQRCAEREREADARRSKLLAEIADHHVELQRARETLAASLQEVRDNLDGMMASLGDNVWGIGRNGNGKLADEAASEAEDHTIPLQRLEIPAQQCPMANTSSTVYSPADVKSASDNDGQVRLRTRWRRVIGRHFDRHHPKHR